MINKNRFISINLAHSNQTPSYVPARRSYLCTVKNFREGGVKKWKKLTGPQISEKNQLFPTFPGGGNFSLGGIPSPYLPLSAEVCLRCCPVNLPQRTGGAVFPGLVTEKESVRHCPQLLTSTPSAFMFTSSPNAVLPTMFEEVLGPVMRKLVKSSLSCNENSFFHIKLLGIKRLCSEQIVSLFKNTRWPSRYFSWLH